MRAVLSWLVLLLLFVAAAQRIEVDHHATAAGHYIDESDGRIDFSKDMEYDNELMRNLASSTVTLSVDADEILGLQYLYNSTNGDYWSWYDDTVTYGIPWNFSGNISLVNPCYDHWQGILCTCNTSYSLNPPYSKGYIYFYYYYDDVTSYSTSSCHITKIFLNEYNLNGVLPGEMFTLLPNLTHLHVGYNLLYSPLPTEMNQSSLVLLDINDNYFSESLETLCSIRTLNALLANSNWLIGDLSPLQLLQSTDIYYLDLGNNLLTGTLDAGNLNSLRNLTVLLLHGNGLSGDLSGVSNMTGLKRLYAYSNQLTGTIDALSNLHSLESLALIFNQHTGTIDVLKNMASLKRLYLFKNQFTGTIDAISNLTSLQRVYLNFNELTGTIDAISNLTSLHTIVLSNNQLTGTIDAVSNLTSLQKLYLGFNLFTGTIDAVSNLTSLTVFGPEYNQLTGTIDAVSSLINLQQLWMGTNHLTGMIDAVSNLTNVYSLYLSENYFAGTIDTISNLTSLFVLNLDYCKTLTGTIDAISNLTSLVHLDLVDNQFTGTIDVLRNLTSLQLISVYSNQLTGTIDAVGNLTSLQFLDLGINEFTGSIDAVRNLTHLLQLDLRCNLLTGTIEAVSNLTSLKLLFLFSNQLTGTIDAVNSLVNLAAVYFSYNMLTGTLGPLVNHLQLQFCIMDHNLFTGSIPSLHNATQLLVFAVGHNLLTGALDPRGFATSIQIIGVSSNMLSGELSMELFALPRLQILSAGINCMTARFNHLVCDAVELQVLILDGIYSSSSCRETMPVRIFDTIYAPYQSVSSIPPCIYSLPNMTNLHLSGNGIIGSLPSDVTLNDGFVELIISNNGFRSVIPEAFQDHRWEVFDVSYNKFSGTLLPSFDVSYEAALKINRISGDIPSSLFNTTDVAALTGNIFTCTSEQLARLGDEVGDSYVCGSNSFTNAGLLWFTVVMVMLVIIGLSYTSRSERVSNTPIERCLASVLSPLHEIRTKFILSSDLTRVISLLSTELKLSADELKQFYSLSQMIRSMTGVITGVFVCLHLPLYCIFSSYYSTYRITYAWTASAAYLSGSVPGAILFVLYFGTFVVPFNMYYNKTHLKRVLFNHHNDTCMSETGTEKSYEMKDRSDNFVVENPLSASAFLADSDEQAAVSAEKRGNNSRRKQRNLSMISVMTLSKISPDVDTINETRSTVKRRFLSMLLISIVNFAVVSTLNFAYVITILNYNGTVVTLVDIAMGLFKALWTNVVIVKAVRWCNVHYKTGQRLSFLSFTSILNNIVIPCIALSLVNPDCFYNLLYSRKDVSSTFQTEFLFYSYFVSDFNDADYFYSIASYESTLLYTPSYTYSYQCSSAILTSYVVIFLYSALFGLMSQPIIDRLNHNVTVVHEKIITQTAAVTGIATSSKESSSNGVFIPVSGTTPIASEAVINRPPINATYFILHQVTMAAIMLSFGCVFPFLSFILFITTICQTKYTEYKIGQYVESVVRCQTLQHEVKVQRINKLNDELKDIQDKLLLSLWQIIPCLGPFYSIFIFDIIGDVYGMKAIFAPILFFIMSVVIYLIPYVLSGTHEKTRTGSSNVGRGSVVDGSWNDNKNTNNDCSSTIIKL